MDFFVNAYSLGQMCTYNEKNVIRNSGVWDKKREKRCDFFVRNESVFSDVELKTNFIDAAD